MAYTFAEGLVDEVIAYLVANMPAKQNTIGDGITMDDVVDFIRRDPSDIRALTNIPSCFVIVPRTQITNWKETTQMQQHDLWIYLVARDPDPETLRKLIYRYARVLWETLVDHYYDTATWKIAGGVQPSFDFSETITRGNMAMADVKVELTYEKLETE
jgi:hypothetical protein